jgi:hypothetical protein
VKVQIVYLSPEDDIHSAREMLGWVKAQRALLVWPDHGSVLSRRLDLVLLKRFSIQRKIEIGLLTFDKDIRDEAAEIGIPVFDSFDDLPEDVWKQVKRTQVQHRWMEEPPSRPSYNEISPERSIGWIEGLGKSQRILILAGILICLVVVIGLLIPSAQVTLTPALEKKSFGIEIELINADFGETSVGLIPVHTVELQAEGKSTRDCSGITQVPISPATGIVTFRNLSQETIHIPANTILRAMMGNVVRFRTIRSAILQGEIGSRVEVPIQALAPGWTGNVPVNSISEVESPLGLYVEVFNEEPTSGGQAEIRRMVLQSDLDQLEEDLIQTLMIETQSKWIASQAMDRIPVEDSLELQDILKRQINHLPGEVADTISIELSLAFSALTISAKDLQEFTIMAHSSALSGDDRPVPGTFSFSARIQPSIGSSEYKMIRIDVNVDTYRTLDDDSIKDMIQGRKPQVATDLLFKRYPLSKRPEFIMSPGWYPFVPVLAQRIKINWSWEMGM